MRLGFKITFLAIALAALISTAAHLYLVFEGKAIIVKHLEGLTKKKVTIDRFSITPLFKLEIKGLKIQDTAKVESVFITPSILGFMTGAFAFNEIQIINPEVTYSKFPVRQNSSASQTNNTPPAPQVKEAPPVVDSARAQKNAALFLSRLLIKKLKITNGKIHFIDYSVAEKGIRITLKDLQFSLTNLYPMAYPAIANFDLSANIPWLAGQEEGRIEAQGWVNLNKKDMKAALKIIGIDGIYLYPYYSNWVDLEKARIEKAKLDFTSNITGLDNNLTAECHLELSDIVRKQRSSEETEAREEKVATAILDIFKALNQGKIVLDFTIRTKLSHPELGFGDIKMAFEEKLATGLKAKKIGVNDIMLFPAKLLEGTVKGASDVSKAAVVGVSGIFVELKNAFGAAFKREKKETQ